MINRIKQSGQTLIELLIVLVIMAMSLTAIGLVAAKSLQLTDVAINNEKANYYLKAGMEYIRLEKEMNSWDIFDRNFGNLPSTLDTEIIDAVDNDEGFTFIPTIIPTISPWEDSCLDYDEICFSLCVEWTDFKGFHNKCQETKLYKLE